MKNYFYSYSFLTGILCLISTLVYSQEEDYCTWEELSPAPNHRVESMTALVNDKLYVFAGFGFEIKILSTTTMYDPASDSWTNKASIPIPITHTGTAVSGNEIWLVGGFEGDNPGVAINNVQVYNTDTDTWREGPSLPEKRASAGLALVGRKLHFFGGLKEDRQTDVSDHYVLDLDNESKGWVSAAPLPEARNHLSAATVGGIIYAIGGQKGHDESIENTALLHAYDPLTDQWTRKADLTFERSHFEPATFVLDGEIYILGGRTEFVFFRHVTKYSPETDTWTELCKLPTKLLAPAARVINNQLYVTHGGDNNVRNPLNTVIRRPVERNFSADMGFLRSSLTLKMNSGIQRTINETVWVKSDAPEYSLSLSGSPSWVSTSTFSGKASHEGDEVKIKINTTGLAPGNYTTVLTARASGYTTASLPISITVNGDATADAIFLNTGGGETTTYNGNNYVNDENTSSYYNSDHTYANSALSNVLYRTERGSSTNAGSLTYDIPVSNGTYTVRTHHAELYFGYERPNGPGNRVFDISLEGQLVKDDVDLYEEGVGLDLSSEAKVFTFEEIEVTDGTLTLTMDASVNRPTISALEIIPESVSPTDELWLEAEEAIVGSNWQIVEDAEASGGKYVTIKGGMNSFTDVPSGSANQISFNFNVDQAGSYQFLARVKAPSYSDDSFWVKVNDGDWVDWSENVRSDVFAWKEMGSPFSLQQGANTLTFAYREDGAQLDQVHIVSEGGSTTTTDFWLESECASSLGGLWEVYEDAEASGGQYATIRTGMNSFSDAPSGMSSHLGFSFNVGQAGNYTIFARVKASNSSKDSFWVKVNDGEWMNWTRNVQTYVFAWKEVMESTFSLQEGENTITFAYREDGAQLDKLFITLDGQQPEGMGENDTNCTGDNNARIANSIKTTPLAKELEIVEEEKNSAEFLIYPNPSVHQVKIQVGQHYEKGEFIYLYNAQGALLQQVEVVEPDVLLDTHQLPAGVYFIQYNNGKTSISRKLMVGK